MLAVSDTGPLNYLVLIGFVHLLPALFDTVGIPVAVRREMTRPETSVAVRRWMARSPAWLTMDADPRDADSDLMHLDEGERSVITLAVASEVGLVLMDDRAGVRAARSKGLAAIGTLGLLDRGARRNLLDIEESIARLRQTSFRCRPALFEALLAHHRRR